MSVTGATPKRVTAFAIYNPKRGEYPSASRVGDNTAVVTTQNDDGSVFRITGCASFGAHGNAYRFCCEKGQIENLRGMGSKVMLRYNAWEKPDDKSEANLYDPAWNDPDEKLIVNSGHGGADFITARIFLEAVRNNTQPPFPFDLYSAVNMSSVAILAHRSMLEGGKPYDIPDFHDEAARKEYENDRLTPFYGSDGTVPNIPCCSDHDYQPTERQLELFHKLIMEE